MALLSPRMTEFTYNRIREVAPGFFNVQAPLVMLDTIQITPELKAEIDQLTDNGQLIEAVVATHPFHTLFFPSFFLLYPNVPYYGTPRHLRIQPMIPWAGDISREEILNKWSPDVEMSIPLGTEFENPSEGVHFTSVFAFHRASKTVHVDDTIMFIENPSCLLSCCGVRPGSMSFHLSFTKDGLLPTAEAPHDFKRWLETVVLEWDFDNLCCAHMGNKIGGAKEKLRTVLEAADHHILKLADKHSKR